MENSAVLYALAAAAFIKEAKAHASSLTPAFWEQYAKHTALNAGQGARDLRYMLNHPDAKTVGESIKKRVASLANNAYYAAIPPHSHHTPEDLEGMHGASVKQWFLHGYKPWEHADPLTKRKRREDGPKGVMDKKAEGIINGFLRNRGLFLKKKPLKKKADTMLTGGPERAQASDPPACTSAPPLELWQQAENEQDMGKKHPPRYDKKPKPKPTPKAIIEETE